MSKKFLKNSLVALISKWFYTIFILLLCCCNKQIIAQTYQTQQTQIFAYNILLNGFIGGIGGAINKNKNEKTYKSFGKNFLKGCLGGAIIYMAKNETYYLYRYDNTFFAKPNRLFYYLGYSFVYNASLNRKLWHSYHCQFYGVNIELIFEDNFNSKCRMSLLSLYYVGNFLLRGYSLNLHKSMEYGLFYFDFGINQNSTFRGFSGHNVIAIKSREKYSSTISHEIIHTYQITDYFSITNLLNKSFVSFKSKKAYTILSKYFYLDIDYMIMLYWLQPKPTYYRNFYEFEAQHFATRRYINR